MRIINYSSSSLSLITSRSLLPDLNDEQLLPREDEDDWLLGDFRRDDDLLVLLGFELSNFSSLMSNACKWFFAVL